jgi:hypothetical protein
MSRWKSYVVDLINGMTPSCKLPHTNHGFTLQGSRVSLTNVCSRYNKDFPLTSCCVRTINIISNKDTKWQSAFEKVQSIVQSKCMVRITSLKSFWRTKDKWTSRTLEDPK